MKKVIILLVVLLSSCGKKTEPVSVLSYQNKEMKKDRKPLVKKEESCFKDIKKASFKEGLFLGSRCPHLKHKTILSYTRDQHLEALTLKKKLNKEETEKLEHFMKSYDQDQERQAIALLERAQKEMERQ